jgi:hypothetical protein
MEDAEAYEIFGGTINVNGTGGVSGSLNTIYNLSRYQQTIHSGLYLTANMVFDTGRAGILWTGWTESAAGEGSYTVTKRGSGDLIVTGDHTTSDKKIAWSVAAGTLVMDASSGTLVSNSNVTLSGGSLKVIGASEGVTTVDLGDFGALNSRLPMKIIVDSNGGEGTTLNFDQWLTGHQLSPGIIYDYRHLAYLHFDLSSPGSAVSMGTIRQQNGANWYSPLTNGVITYATVTDGVKTGFATVVGGDEYGNGGNIARYTDWTALPTGTSVGTTNYRVEGSIHLTGGATVNTLTIGGAGTLTSANSTAQINSKAILMEEGVGDYYLSIANVGHSDGSQIRVYNYSTDGVLIITGHVGSRSGNYGNSRFVSAGPGTVRLTGDGKIGASIGFGVIGEFAVSEGRLELDGLGGITIPVLEVFKGTLAGKGQIGGGIKWVWNSPGGMQNQGIRYSEVVVYDGGTLDGSNVGQKALTVYGSVLLNAESTYFMRLAEERGDALSVLSVINNPDAPEIASVTLNGDLALELTYAPGWAEWIVLLTTDGNITGEFATINGQAFTQHVDTNYDGTGLYLSYNSRMYEFRIVYNLDLGDGITAVALHAVPEPSTIALLSGLGLLGLVYLRRRKVG